MFKSKSPPELLPFTVILPAGEVTIYAHKAGIQEGTLWFRREGVIYRAFAPGQWLEVGRKT